MLKLISIQKQLMPNNEVDCLAAGYFWYADKCNELLPAIELDCSLYGYNWWFGECHTETFPVTELECSTAGYYWWAGVCNETTFPATEVDCLAAGLYWYDDVCNETPDEFKYFLAFDQTKITGTLDNFLLTLTGDVLPAELMTGANSSVDGSDIQFFDENDNRIPSHVRYFDKVNSLFEINVNIPSMTTTTTGIYISWGNPATVPELADGAYGQYATYGTDAWMIHDGTLESSDPWLKDLSANGRDATTNTAGTNAALYYRSTDDGFLGKSLEAHTDIISASQLKITSLTQNSFQVTASMWVKFDNTDTGSRWLFLWRTSNYYLGIYRYLGGTAMRAYASGVYISPDINIRDGLWHHVAVTRGDVSTITFYIDGVNMGDVYKTYSSSAMLNMFYAGIVNNKFTNMHFYESCKTADWIKTTYDVHINLSAFITAITQV